METEFEAKFYPINKEEYRKKLLSMGAKLTIPERKMRRLIGDKLVNPQINCDYIRIRDEGNLVRLSAKVHAKNGGKIGDQKEEDIVVLDFDKTKEIFEASGFKFNRYQETLREEWEFESAAITIDTWPGLLPYSEIETSSEEKVKEIAEKLGFDWNNKILTSAPDILSKVYGLPIEDVLEKVVNITFENNPFEGMKKVWTPVTQSQ